MYNDYSDGSVFPMFGSFDEQANFFEKKHQRGRLAMHIFVQDCKIYCLTCILFDRHKQLATSATSDNGRPFGRDDTFLNEGLENCKNIRSLHNKLSCHHTSKRHICCSEIKQLKAEGLIFITIHRYYCVLFVTRETSTTIEKSTIAF